MDTVSYAEVHFVCPTHNLATKVPFSEISVETATNYGADGGESYVESTEGMIIVDDCPICTHSHVISRA